MSLVSDQGWKDALKEAMMGGFGTERLRRANELLLEIAKCPVALTCLRERTAHPCSTIVESQKTDEIDFHVPEPWSGHIVGAPLLFLSSNPSIGRPTETNPIGEAYPRFSWPDEQTVSFFQERFDGYWIRDGNKSRQDDGSYPSHGTAFWSAVRNRAHELLGGEPRPGFDYALSEVVHCKSISEQGVWSALETCTGLYLRRVLEAAGAPVIVVMGETAAYAVRKEFTLATAASRALSCWPTERECSPSYLILTPSNQERPLSLGLLNSGSSGHF